MYAAKKVPFHENLYPRNIPAIRNIEPYPIIMPRCACASEVPYRGYNYFEGINVCGFRGLGMNREFNISCMHAAKNLKVLFHKKLNPRNFIPSKYTRYSSVYGSVFVCL